MKYYLSSFKLGNETEKLKELLAGVTGKIGFIPNALDFTDADPVRKQQGIAADINDIEQLGANVEIVDLKEYFGKPDELRTLINSLGGLYVRGGNSFILRQAMFLSGFDKIILDLQSRDDFLYVAYSAGVCVLTKDMSVYAITDDAKDFPYAEVKEQIWDGISIFDFAFEPHYKSDHPESASTDQEVQYCIDNKILFKAYRDGEVLIIE
jgi:dipeptidase E